jgi:hypothetical protein
MRNFLLLGALSIAGAAARAQPTAAPVPAATPAPVLAAQRAAALDLLTAMQTEQQLDAQIDVMLASQKAAQEQLLAKSPELRDPMAGVQAELRQFYQKVMGWEAVKEDMVQAYSRTFSAEELRSLTAFYHSETGQMLVRKQPGATRQVAAATQRRMTVLMPELQRIMLNRLQQNPPTGAAPKTPGN